MIGRREVIPGMGQPALVATVRRIPLTTKPSRPWRPDLWPWWVWCPLLCAPGVLVAMAIIAAMHLMAN